MQVPSYAPGGPTKNSPGPSLYAPSYDMPGVQILLRLLFELLINN